MSELLHKVPELQDNPHMEHQLDASYRNLDRAVAHVTMADNKALIALTFQGAIVAGLALIAGSLKSALERQSSILLALSIAVFLVAFFLCFCIATLRLFQTISPRSANSALNDDHPSFLFFFGGIARMHPDTFASRMRSITPREIHEGVMTVTHNTARIASQKMQNLRVAYLYLGLQMVFYVVIVVLSVLPSHI